jgi:hypothetical protein
MRTVVVHDSLQRNYQYTLSAPEGELGDDFTPDLTPQQMLGLGVFGGHYFEGEIDEFPRQWFVDVKMSDTHDPTQNYFMVEASQSREEWLKKGWISPEDPRGWFQWYCRYYLGRRLGDEDTRQIKRWRNMSRHIGQIKAHCREGDELCRPRQRQALLHWAYDSRAL